MTRAGRPLRVVKLGGSLLNWPGLLGALSAWAESNAGWRNVVIVGGGALVDTIRQTDQAHQLGQEQAHWLAVEAMRINARWVAAKLGVPALWDGTFAGEVPEDLWANLPEDMPERWSVLDPWRWLRSAEPTAMPKPGLPQGWHVTSDSIAARFARVVRAEELVLLKSREAAGCDPVSWAAEELVDPYFPTASRGLPGLRVVNLRAWGER